jgi:hypothetical protein
MADKMMNENRGKRDQNEGCHMPQSLSTDMNGIFKFIAV